MSMIKRPLLSATITRFEEDEGKLYAVHERRGKVDRQPIQFPLILSPKIDGIRCLLLDGLCFSRSMKPIPNAHIRYILRNCSYDFDGELVVGDHTNPKVFNGTTSGVMSYDGEPNFTYFVFDRIPDEYLSTAYRHRFHSMHELLRGTRPTPSNVPPQVRPVEWHTVHNVEDVEKWAKHYGELGYEGVMLRDPDALYKQGRSTLKEGVLMKLKPFEDAEAKVIGFEELMHNNNVPAKSEIGLQVRSAHKANQVPGNTLGMLVCESKEWPLFKIGSGFSQFERQEIWDNRSEFLNKLVTFKFQRHGSIDAPRSPIYKGWRLEE